MPCRVFSCTRNHPGQKQPSKPPPPGLRGLTSMTCFLLDLSLDAHSTEPPLRSTVNSGLDWLPPNWTEGADEAVIGDQRVLIPDRS